MSKPYNEKLTLTPMVLVVGIDADSMPIPEVLL